MRQLQVCPNTLKIAMLMNRTKLQTKPFEKLRYILRIICAFSLQVLTLAESNALREVLTIVQMPFDINRIFKERKEMNITKAKPKKR